MLHRHSAAIGCRPLRRRHVRRRRPQARCGRSASRYRHAFARPAPSHQINVYAHDGANMLTGAARRARPLIYVPNSGSDTVDVIDPATRRVIRHFPVGAEPQHVVPSWDLKPLYVTNDRSNTLTPIDPVTGRPGRPIPVADPYNLYFTPDGTRAIVVAERLDRLDFRDPHSFAADPLTAVPCARRRPHRLLGQRPLPARHLRVLRADPEGRRQARTRDRHAAAAGRRRRRCPRTSSSPRTGRCSTSPT